MSFTLLQSCVAIHEDPTRIPTVLRRLLLMNRLPLGLKEEINSLFFFNFAVDVELTWELLVWRYSLKGLF